MKNLHTCLVEKGYEYHAVGIGDSEKNKPSYEKMIKEGKISKYVFIEILDVGDSLKLKGIPIKLYTHAIYIKK
jgi:hypothetical protein